MTKRDVAVWFCRVIGLVGMTTAIFGALNQLFYGVGLQAWGSFGSLLPQFALYLFVYLLANNIGTEIAAEGEHGEPVSSGAQLNSLLLRCLGLGLLLSATSSFALMMLQLGLNHFFSRSAFPPVILSFYVRSAIFSLVQSAIGFALAFGPRLGAALRSH